MLAVTVDYESKRATVGVAKGESIPRQEILDALKKINYQGEFIEAKRNEPESTEAVAN